MASLSLWLSTELSRQHQRREAELPDTLLNMMSTASRPYLNTANPGPEPRCGARHWQEHAHPCPEKRVRTNMRSVGVARFLSGPVLGQAERWVVSLKIVAPLHRASVTGSGRASRSSNSTRKRCGGTVHSGAVVARDRRCQMLPTVRPFAWPFAWVTCVVLWRSLPITKFRPTGSPPKALAFQLCCRFSEFLDTHQGNPRRSICALLQWPRRGVALVNHLDGVTS